MSYCRFSSDGFQCDVYVYADVRGGYTTHVASSRRSRRVPDLDSSSPEKFKESYAAYRATLDDPENEPVAIGLSEDGKSFNHGTARECADNLERLQAIGYNVPQYAIDELR